MELKNFPLNFTSQLSKSKRVWYLQSRLQGRPPSSPRPAIARNTTNDLAKWLFLVSFFFLLSTLTDAPPSLYHHNYSFNDKICSSFLIWLSCKNAFLEHYQYKHWWYEWAQVGALAILFSIPTLYVCYCPLASRWFHFIFFFKYQCILHSENRILCLTAAFHCLSVVIYDF